MTDLEKDCSDESSETHCLWCNREKTTKKLWCNRSWKLFWLIPSQDKNNINISKSRKNATVQIDRIEISARESVKVFRLGFRFNTAGVISNQKARSSSYINSHTIVSKRLITYSSTVIISLPRDFLCF